MGASPKYQDDQNLVTDLSFDLALTTQWGKI